MNTGAILEDFRTEQKKARDFHASELGLGRKTVWREIDIENYSHPAFKRVKEQGASTCGGHSGSNTIQGLEYKETGNTEVLSATMVYQSRAGNYEGMSMPDVANALRKVGATYDMFLPSDKASDETILRQKPTSTDKAIGQFLSVGSTFYIPDFDSLCEYLETTRVNGVCNPAVILTSWNDRDWGVVIKEVTSTKPYGHFMTVVEYGTVNGEEGVVLADSFSRNTANPQGFRFMPRSYFKNVRAILGVTDKNNVLVVSQETPVKPTYTLKEWQENDTNCQELQRFLADLGLFPKTQDYTGLYGSITKNAVKKFQIKYNVTSIDLINKYQGQYFGKASLAKARELTK